MTFNRVVYETLDVCNPVSMATIEAALEIAVPGAAGRALDIGCGNAAVAIRLARRFGLSVDAVELDPLMAELAERRIAMAGAADRIVLHQTRSDAVLAKHPPFDLIVALGVTEPVGGGIRDPEGMIAGLAAALNPGGVLLWGDLVWVAEPSPPLRQIIELTNTLADHEGWQAAARAAGLEVVWARLSDADDWTAYREGMDRAAADWLGDHPDHPDAAAIEARARQVAMMFDFGREALGFGLYLLRKP